MSRRHYTDGDGIQRILPAGMEVVSQQEIVDNLNRFGHHAIVGPLVITDGFAGHTKNYFLPYACRKCLSRILRYSICLVFGHVPGDECARCWLERVYE